MRNFLLIPFLCIYIFSSGQDYTSIKNITGQNCSEIAFDEYQTIKKQYLQHLQENLESVININNNFYLKSKLDSMLVAKNLKDAAELNLEDQKYKYQFNFKYKNYNVYGRSPSSTASNLYSLDILSNKKHLETVDFLTDGGFTIETYANRYKMQEIYSANPGKCTYSIMDTYMSNVFVGNSLIDNGQETVFTDWDKQFKISNDILLKMLPSLFPQAIQIQKQNVKNMLGKNTGSGVILSNDDLKDAYQYFDQILKNFNNDFKDYKKSIRFEKFINSNNTPIWKITYGIVIILNGSTGEILKVYNN
ncbi:hypothetical protein PYS58_20500 [Chryseobacterium indologenes]|uniref:hypothetical protein n=1 Tax=Chryseobacterium indologenes TaxID=253 RepID=UPI0023E77BD4|nr:hypothetical protein [Chryseobacterium indologenes]WET48913.1 hypothetical protein PYS58_20500 [Chryseobacterium indologenes]